MNPTERRKQVDLFSNQPMSSWFSLCSGLKTSDAMELSDAAAAVAVQMARFSAYLSRLRATGGKHADAVKAQNKAARGTRQALGYTYKDDAITF